RAPREHQDPRRFPHGGRTGCEPAPAGLGSEDGDIRSGGTRRGCAPSAPGRAQARESIGTRRQHREGGCQEPDPEAGPDRNRRRRRRPARVAAAPPLEQSPALRRRPSCEGARYDPRVLRVSRAANARRSGRAAGAARRGRQNPRRWPEPPPGDALPPRPARGPRRPQPAARPLPRGGAVRDLSYVEERGDHLAIGTLTREHQLEESPVVTRSYPLLLDTARVVADPLVRNRATVGGNLAHADPANDHPATMLAYDATIVVR